MRNSVADKRPILILFVIILIGSLLRIWTIDFDLPYIYHPDETVPIAIVHRILKTRDLNPHFYHWPPLLMYVNLVAYYIYFLIGNLFGVFQTVQDLQQPIEIAMGTSWSPMPSLILMSRLISVAGGIGAIICVYMTTSKLFNNKWAGLIASGLLAVSPASVQHDRYIAPDSLATFLICLALLFSVYIFKEGKWKYYLLAGLVTGLAVSAKYNAGLILLTAIFAHLLTNNWRDWISGKLILLGACALAGFLIGNPYALLDYSAQIEGLTFNATHYASGHPGMEGDTLNFYISYLYGNFGLICLLAIGALGLMLLPKMRKEIALISLFPVLYFLIVSRFIVRNARTILPLTPFMFILAAILIMFLLNQLNGRLLKNNTVVIRVALALLIVGFLASLPLQKTISAAGRTTIIDSRITAREWIDEQLETGSKIGLESYSPYVDVEKFDVAGFHMLIDQEPDWYVAEGYDYLIFAEGMFGRFFKDTNSYANQVARYSTLFEQFEEVQTFNDGEYEVRVYKTK